MVGDGVFVLPNKISVKHKGPYPPTKESCDTNRSYHAPFEDFVYTQFEKSPRLPVAK